MPYTPSVNSSIALATTSVGSANLSSTLFATTNTYFSNRITSYSSVEELRADDRIPSTSPAYKALLKGLSQPGGTVPLYLGRREADSLILTPTSVIDNKNYGLIITVIDDATSTPVVTTIAVDSGSSATPTSLSLALQLAIDAVSDITATDTSPTVTVAADVGYTFNISTLDRLEDTYTTSETAAELIAAITEENNTDWYFFECEDHSETFALAAAIEIEATETSDYPKMYHFGTDDANSIIALADPAIDVIGKLKEFGYNRTAAYWNDDTSVYEEVAKTVYNGQFQAGTTTWKFMTNLKGVPAAANPATGSKLSTALQGYLEDRNANWQAEERSANFAHSGKTVGGEWIDVIRAKDWLNDTIEVRLLNLFLRQVGGRIPFTPAGKLKVKNTIDGVLKEAVDLGILFGYVPTTIPDITSFEDQAARLLKQVNWVGYLAGAIHFIVVDGILTYADEAIA